MPKQVKKIITKNCEKCPDKKFENILTLRQHKWGYHSIFYCTDCGEKLCGRQTIETSRHTENCSKKYLKDQKCSYCPLVIKGNPELLQNH